MQLGELLVTLGLVTHADIEGALERQNLNGARLGENLVAMGILSEERLASVINSMPPVPSSVTETGILPRNLLNLLLKLMYVESLGTVLELANRMKLPGRIVQALLDDATRQRFVEAGSTPGNNAFTIRYSLGEQGKNAAKQALDQNLYLGPAPVPLAAYQQQIEKQRITNELLDEDSLRQGFAGLVVPDRYFEKLLPAINAGRSVLLFGPPGNGKTTLAGRIANLFRDVVYIPHAVDINGQIMTVYDPRVHNTSAPPGSPGPLKDSSVVERERLDERWVACKRPVAMTGGELTLDMLDLRYDRDTRFYEAPLHVKALNGMLLIDDFGRQAFDPSQLLNRWIVPMENQIDYLKLSSGATFSIPFDELVIFSTNLDPSDLIDPAFLRRIPYKIRLSAPSRDEYWRIFEAVARTYGLELTTPVFDVVVERLERRFGLAYYQPKFICQQVVEFGRTFRRPTKLTRAAALSALSNLYYDIEDQCATEIASGRQPHLVSFA